MPRRFALAVGFALALTATAPTQDDRLSRKEVEALVAEYFELDLSLAGGRAEGRRILEQLASVPYPNASGLRRWEKAFDKLRQKLPALPKKKGEHFDLDGGRGRYFLGGSTGKPKGLFLGMHGGGEGSGDASGSHDAYVDAIGQRDWLGVFPEVLEKTEHGWTDSGTEEWVLSLVDRALRTWDIDPNNVFFGGHSMGGYGSWVLGAHHADRVAALLPSAGAPSPVYDQAGKVVRIQTGVIPNLRNVPMCVFQSTDDPKVGPAANQGAVAEVEKARKRYGGYDEFEYWEVHDREHGYPEGGVEALIARIEGYVRDPRPSKVVWQPGIDWKEQFYWLLWEEPKLRATIVAEILREQNTVEVQARSSDGKGLSVLLSAELLDVEEEVLVYLDGKLVFQGIPEPDFATYVRTAAHGDPGRRYSIRIPLNE